jgi:tetratricopeptide (TPR) repeat protein
MLAKLSIDQTIFKAKSHLKKGEITEAKKLYLNFLEIFPKNNRIKEELNALIKLNQKEIKSPELKNKVNYFIDLYNHNQFITLVKEAKVFLEKFPKEFIVWNILGVSLTQLKKLDEAVVAYEKALSIKPNYVDAYYNLGNALQEQNKLDASIEAYEKTLSLDTDYNKALIMMGNALQEKGDLKKALSTYKKALSLDPNNSDLHNNIGNALQAQGKLEASLLAYKKAIYLKPYNGEAYGNMGNTLQAQKEFVKAIEAYDVAIELMPHNSNLFFNKGICLHKIGKLNKAIQFYKKAISLQPDNADAFINMGNTFQDLEDPNKAIESYKKALSFKPNNLEAHNNIGKSLFSLGLLDQAMEYLNKAISLNPSYIDSYSNIGVVYMEQGEFEKAIEIFKKGISLSPSQPEAYHNLSFALLRNGKIKEGLEAYEWRKKTEKFLSTKREFFQPYWDGKKSLKDKKILVWCEQGIGETIRWSSCLPLLSTKAEKCIIECQPKLVSLLKRSFPEIEVKPENRELDSKRNDFDFHLPMGSLYKCFLDEILNSSKANSYLIPDQGRILHWKNRLASLGSGPYVGISWKSSLLNFSRNKNYSSISEWAPILNTPDITFINLQYKNFEDDLVKVKNEFGIEIHNFNDLDQYENIDDTSALYAALDMVISHNHSPHIISSAVGTPTKLAIIRQNTNNNNFLFAPAGSKVDTFEKDTDETWENVFCQIAMDLQKK